MSNKQAISDEAFIKFIEDYCFLIKEGLNERWEKMPKDLYNNESQEVIGALLSRQVTLAQYVASVPEICNPHIAPLILRAMIDLYITISYIFKDIDKRSKQFLEYGLSQEKLNIEHLKASGDSRVGALIEAREDWVNEQKLTYLLDVDIGHWAGENTRKMAEDIGELELYRYAYAPFSACGHNMWNHVGLYNLKTCTNPLHKYHKVPAELSVPYEFDFVYRAGKYLQMTFIAFDKQYDMSTSTQLPLDFIADFLKDDPTNEDDSA